MNRTKYTEESISRMTEEFIHHTQSVTETPMGMFIDWHKPGTCVYAVRYILTGHYLIATGDLGEFVFNLTSKADIHDFKKVDYEYLIGKLSACRENNGFVFCPELAIEMMKSCFCDEELGKAETKALQRLCNFANECCRIEEWKLGLTTDFEEDWEKLNVNAVEWIFDCGNIFSDALIGVIRGLEMAANEYCCK